tara:strand:+ start:373 stop:513 length:141 start_codon:yes stop_codon:yes gene_type:complete
MKDYGFTMLQPAADVTPPQDMERINRFSKAFKKEENKKPEISKERL